MIYVICIVNIHTTWNCRQCLYGCHATLSLDGQKYSNCVLLDGLSAHQFKWKKSRNKATQNSLSELFSPGLLLLRPPQGQEWDFSPNEPSLTVGRQCICNEVQNRSRLASIVVFKYTQPAWRQCMCACVCGEGEERCTFVHVYYSNKIKVHVNTNQHSCITVISGEWVFPGSHTPEREHWSCAGMESLVFFVTWPWCNQNGTRVFRTDRQHFVCWLTNNAFNVGCVWHLPPNNKRLVVSCPPP